MNDPTHPELPGEPRVRARYGDLVAVFGEPESKSDADLLVVFARWLSDDELRTLTKLVKRSRTGDGS